MPSHAFWHVGLAKSYAPCPAPSSEVRRFTLLVQLGPRFFFVFTCLTVTGNQ